MTNVQPHYDACFVGLKCYDLLSNNPIPKYLGGIERALVSLAKGMVDQGYKVAFITYDEGQQDIVNYGGIDVYKAFKPKAGIKFVRLLAPQATTLFGLIKSINADMYIQMGAGIETTYTALAVKWLQKKRKTVYIIASNSDCQPELPLVTTRHEKIIYRLGLPYIDTIVAQSAHQQTQLQANFHQVSSIITMPHYIDYPFDATQRQEQPIAQKVLWVGRIIEVKRLEFLLDIAQQKPAIEFHIVGAPNEASDYSNQLVERVTTIDNAHYHGKVDDATLYSLFTQCSLLSCTSSLEGFPMAFIEGWYFGMPIVTTFDPDDIIAKNELGQATHSIEETADAIEHILSNPETYKTLSQRAYAFYKQSYTPASVVPQYIKLTAG